MKPDKSNPYSALAIILLTQRISRWWRQRLPWATYILVSINKVMTQRMLTIVMRYSTLQLLPSSDDSVLRVSNDIDQCYNLLESLFNSFTCSFFPYFCSLKSTYILATTWVQDICRRNIRHTFVSIWNATFDLFKFIPWSLLFHGSFS